MDWIYLPDGTALQPGEVASVKVEDANNGAPQPTYRVSVTMANGEEFMSIEKVAPLGRLLTDFGISWSFDNERDGLRIPDSSG